MNAEKKAPSIFIGFTFIWSFAFWGMGIFISLTRNLPLLENADLLNELFNKTLVSDLYTVSILNALAGYGPLLGAILIFVLFPETRRRFKNQLKGHMPFKYFLQIILLFLIITIVPIFPIFLKDGLDRPLTWSLFSFFLLFFLYQLLTAATEEVGWRGVLLPSLLKTETPWQASLKIGVIWALWHTPIVLYVFYYQGLPLVQILLSFAGFVAGTIAMSTVHTFYYLKTKNVIFNLFIHAIANTIPMFVGMLFAKAYEVSVAVQVFLWIFVFVITKKNKDLFDTVQN